MDNLSTEELRERLALLKEIKALEAEMPIKAAADHLAKLQAIENTDFPSEDDINLRDTHFATPAERATARRCSNGSAQRLVA